ncbi:MAG: glutamate racemase [Christensenellales bacterium]
MDNRPIGIFDSGMGGLSVLKTAMALLPNEDYIYFGDDGNAPYGTKPEERIVELALNCARFLADQGVKAIVVACNTATSAAINHIRSRLQLPVISMEPAIKPAVENSAGGRILMMATPATCSLMRYQNLLKRVDTRHQVENVPCPGLVELIEAGKTGKEVDDQLARLLGEYDGQRIDGIVLGCTHYPFIRENIQRYAREHFAGEPRLFDGNAGTVRQLKRVLAESNLLSDKTQGSVQLYTSGDAKTVIPAFERMLAEYRPVLL